MYNDKSVVESSVRKQTEETRKIQLRGFLRIFWLRIMKLFVVDSDQESEQEPPSSEPTLRRLSRTFKLVQRYSP